MRQALKLAQRGIGNTSPNPIVGAIVVQRDGTVVGSGYHARAGAEHAETLALNQAGNRARGATLYVTLEPCAHQGKTPPCVDAIKAAGIARVVSALEDPDAQVRGRGYACLQEFGIEVVTGVEELEAARLNRMYLHHRKTGTPFVTLKMAQSLDGAVATREGERRQLTGNRATGLVRKLRYDHDAVMVGAGTIVVDDPQLTVRPFKPRAVPYTRIVVDARGRIPLNARVFKDQRRAKTIVATTDIMPPQTREALAAREITVLQCERDALGFVDLDDLMRRLGRQDVISILCEGGPTLAGSLLRSHLVNELVWFVAPLVIGGETRIPVVADGARDIPLEIVSIKKLGDDVLLTAQTKR